MKLLIMLFVFAVSPILDTVVNEFHTLSDKGAELEFILEYENHPDPSIKAYVIAIKMKQAEYSFNPIKKINTFRINKNELNELIEKNSENIHLRYVRLLLQESTPWFLAYKNHIEEDKRFLTAAMEQMDKSDHLYAYIIKNTSL